MLTLFKHKKRRQRYKKRKLTRDQKKKIKARRKRNDRRKANFKGQNGFMSENGYVEYNGYIRIGLENEKKYMAIFDVQFVKGTNNPAPYGWMNRLIPSENVAHGSIFFVYREKRTSKAVQNDIFGKRLESRYQTAKYAKRGTNTRANSRKDIALQDMDVAKQLSANENVFDTDIALVVKAHTPMDLETIIKRLKTSYKTAGIDGVQFIRKTSFQMKELQELITGISANAWHTSQMASTVAANLFFPSSGYADTRGTFVGYDINSYLPRTPSIVDFNGIRNACIITGGEDGILSLGGKEGAARARNFGSAWAHVIADDNYLVNGTRTHHIVLTPFEYHAYDSQVFDMTKYTINTLECYVNQDRSTHKYNLQDVINAANQNFDKILTIILMLIGEENLDPSYHSTLQRTLINWIIERAGGNGIWTDDPENNPRRAYRIIATTDHKSYPTLEKFIPELDSMVAEEKKNGEEAGKIASIMRDNVDMASRRFGNVFNKPTDIPDSFSRDDRNIYYDLSGLDAKDMLRGAFFLNVLAYVTFRAQPGDMIVIHGLDSVKVSDKILAPYRRQMVKKGVGLVTTFERPFNEDMNIYTLNDFCHSLKDQDAVIIGSLNDRSTTAIEKSWGRPLPDIVKRGLSEGGLSSVYWLYRKSDLGSAVIDTHLIL